MRDPSPAEPSVLLATQAMATRFEIALFGDRIPHLRAAGEAALDEIRRWHLRLSAFDPASDISRINREAATSPVRCDPELFALLALAQTLCSASEGAFNIALGPALRAAGFRDTPRDATALEAARDLAAPGSWVLDPHAHTIRFTRPGVALDLGAIGKGWALDRAADVLREAGVTTGFLHGGNSSALAINSSHTNPLAFPITLGRAPGARTLHVTNAALGLSAPSGRTIDARGHILDPRTALSVSFDGHRAVVVPFAPHMPHPAACADAWSTAYLVLGRPPRPPP
ncbi:MAG: FAD:protein FMN transferase [Phycisphaerales bacterium]